MENILDSHGVSKWGLPAFLPLASSCHSLLWVVSLPFSHTAGETRFFFLLCLNADCGDRGSSEDEGAESLSGFSSKPQEKYFVYTIDTPQAPGWS